MWREDGALLVRADPLRVAGIGIAGSALMALAIVAITRAGAGFWEIFLLVVGAGLIASAPLLLAARPRLVIAETGVDIYGVSLSWDQISRVEIGSVRDPLMPLIRLYSVYFHLTRVDALLHGEDRRARRMAELAEQGRAVRVPLRLMNAPPEAVADQVSRWSGLTVDG